MEKVIRINSLEETIELGNRLGRVLKPNMLITLSGDLGAGKTTFTKGIGQGLEIKKIINSPTFTILKQYSGRLKLSHFDAYRLENHDEELGFEEMFEGGGVSVIEWAEFIGDILPVERLEINISIQDDNSRVFTFRPIGKQYEDIVKEIDSDENHIRHI